MKNKDYLQHWKGEFMKLKICDKDILLKYCFAFVTTIGWLITSYLLYYTQYHIYGGTIETLWLYVAIFVPIIGIAELLRDRKSVV